MQLSPLGTGYLIVSLDRFAGPELAGGGCILGGEV